MADETQGYGQVFTGADAVETQIEAVARYLDRPLTSTERQKLVAHIKARSSEWGAAILAAVGATAPDLSAYELRKTQLASGRLLELIAVVMGTVDVGEPLKRLAGQTEADRVRQDAPEGTDTTKFEGMPDEWAERVTDYPDGIPDIFHRPYVGIVNGMRAVWDPEFGEIQAYVPEEEEEEGPLPIGAAQLGITKSGQLLPTNLGERQIVFDEKVAELARQADYEAEALGLADTYEAPGFSWSPTTLKPGVTYGEPNYFTGDNWIDFATKTPEYQTEVQYALYEAGLLDEDDIAQGTWTIEASRAMEVAMFEANATGGAKNWTDVLKDRAAGLEAAGNAPGGRGASRRALTLPAYREPDYATIEMDVKDAMRRELRRDPLPWEMAVLGDQMSANYRAAYEGDIEALKNEFVAGSGVAEEGGISGEPGSVPAVDPIARLRSQLEERFAPERELLSDREDERTAMSNVMNVMTQMQNFAGVG